MTTPAAPVRPPDDTSAAAELLGGIERLLVAIDSDLGSAEADLAVGPALLATVARTPDAGWFRLYRPTPTLGFSRRDTRSRGFADAADAARVHGFQPAVRAPGGRAVAYHRSCLCFELVLPDSGLRDPSRQMSALGHLLAGVLRGLGVDAGVGEIPGEYCPGRFSVNAGGVAKIVGTAGRRTRGAILLGGSILIADADPVREVLAAVYPALELPLDPRTVDSAVRHGCTVANPLRVGDALVAALASATRIVAASLPELNLDKRVTSAFTV